MLHGTWCYFLMCINNSVNCQYYVQSVMNEWVRIISGVTVTGHNSGLNSDMQAINCMSHDGGPCAVIRSKLCILCSVSKHFNIKICEVWFWLLCYRGMIYCLSRTWISNPRPASLSCVAHSRISKLCVYYQNYTIISIVTFTSYCCSSICVLRTSLQ